MIKESQPLELIAKGEDIKLLTASESAPLVAQPTSE
jgi:hypothetical protein